MRISNELERREKERKKEEGKKPFIVANYVSACSQGQRTHSSQTNCLLQCQSFLYCYYSYPLPLRVVLTVLCSAVQSMQQSLTCQHPYRYHIKECRK